MQTQMLEERWETMSAKTAISDTPDVHRFGRTVLEPAFLRIKSALEEKGRRVEVETGERTGTVSIYEGGDKEFEYQIQLSADAEAKVCSVNCFYRHPRTRLPTMDTAEFPAGPRRRNLFELSSNDILRDFVRRYR